MLRKNPIHLVRHVGINRASVNRIINNTLAAGCALAEIGKDFGRRLTESVVQRSGQTVKRSDSNAVK